MVEPSRSFFGTNFETIQEMLQAPAGFPYHVVPFAGQWLLIADPAKQTTEGIDGSSVRPSFDMVLIYRHFGERSHRRPSFVLFPAATAAISRFRRYSRAPCPAPPAANVAPRLGLAHAKVQHIDGRSSASTPTSCMSMSSSSRFDPPPQTPQTDSLPFQTGVGVGGIGRPKPQGTTLISRPWIFCLENTHASTERLPVGDMTTVEG